MADGKDPPPHASGAPSRRQGKSLRDGLRKAITHHRAGRLKEAADLYRRVLEIQPDNAGVCNNLGRALKALGRHREAAACFRRALAIDPDAHDSIVGLADSLRDLGRIDEAIAAYRRALAIEPDNPRTRQGFGIALYGLGKLEDAADQFEKALTRQPGFIEAHHNLGNVRQDQGRLDEAVHHYRQALTLEPRREQAHSSLGNALRHLGRLDEARHHHREAVAINPDYAVGHLNKAVTDLLLGDFDTGLAEYEWRWRSAPFRRSRRSFRQPMWDGTPLDGRAILLHVEQGLGDAIQFARYIPLVRDRGGRVIVECHAPLVRLLSGMKAVDAVIAEGDPRPDFDVYAPLMSLPYVFCTTVGSVPASVPYLAPPPSPTPSPGARDGTYRVGFVWAGSATHTNDLNRSCRVEQFERLLSVPGASFFSLQKGRAAGDLKTLAPGPNRPHDLGEGLSDFADTAAVVQQLDLVISVDTSVVHLAGALARPVWVLLPFAPDWRWLCDREDSPWYPTARLFRQTAIGEWTPVFSRVADALEAAISTHRDTLP